MTVVMDLGHRKPVDDTPQNVNTVPSGGNGAFSSLKFPSTTVSGTGVDIAKPASISSNSSTVIGLTTTISGAGQGQDIPTSTMTSESPYATSKYDGPRTPTTSAMTEKEELRRMIEAYLRGDGAEHGRQEPSSHGGEPGKYDHRGDSLTPDGGFNFNLPRDNSRTHTLPHRILGPNGEFQSSGGVTHILPETMKVGPDGQYEPSSSGSTVLLSDHKGTGGLVQGWLNKLSNLLK